MVPAEAKSRNFVLRPMLRKLKVKTQTRSVLIGVTNFGLATAL